MADDSSIEGFAERRRKQREEEEAQPTLITLNVDQHPDMDDEPFMVGCLKLKGELPVKKDLSWGDRLTVQVAGPDGEVVAAGTFEVAVPAFKPITQPGAGIIGTERVHTADFAPGH